MTMAVENSFFLNQDIFVNIQHDTEEKPFKIPKKYEWLATDTIGERKLGEQTWIGRIIGKNQQYIHFRDKTLRIWIFVGKNRIEQLQTDDLILLKIFRTKEKVHAREIYVLNEVVNEAVNEA